MITYEFGYSQLGAIDLNLKFIELRLLRYIQTYVNSGKMVTEEHQGKTYYWVSYNKLLADLPILNIKKRQLSNYFKNMVDIGVLEFYQKKKAGNYTFYRFTDLYYDKLLLSMQENEHTVCEENDKSVCEENYKTYGNNLANKDNILNNNKLNNNKLNNNKLNNNKLNNNKLNNNKETPPKKTDLDFSTFLQNNIFSTTLLNPTNEFIEHRKDMKKPLSYKGLERLVKKINDYKGKYTETEIISFIDKAIVNNWLDLYPPQESDWAKEQARLKEKEDSKTDYDWNEY